MNVYIPADVGVPLKSPLEVRDRPGIGIAGIELNVIVPVKPVVTNWEL